MSSIKEVVTRINSVTATQQITKAMKMVAAAKLNKAQQQVQNLRPYATTLNAILNNVMASIHQTTPYPHYEERPLGNLLLIVIGSDRGLCGSANANVYKKALSYLQQESYEHAEILPIGKKVQTFFAKRDFQLVSDYVALSHDVDHASASQAAAALTSDFLAHKYDRIVLVYNEFRSAATQEPQAVPLLPMAAPDASLAPAADYIYEPSREALIEELLPQALQTHFYQALLEASASEHGARMTTMSKATDNADELLQSLRLTYNRTRQAAITREISEIVAGAEALAS